MFGDDDGVEPQLMAGDYIYTEDKNNGDDINDGHADDNEGTDVLCALCDDGGKLLSCIGQCKRSFHPRKTDGRESKCKTLGYNSKKLKKIGAYVCKNCKYKKHQCFKCGELEPSDEPNAKVFKCKDSSCGHFYHPKCVAKLLEPDDSDGDENCELEKRIMAGMPFTCPVHWCFECRRMEDRTQRAMQFAVCRRCPKSYHRECLPRGISFDTEDKQVKQCAWELSKIIMIYCLDHKIYKATGNAERDHIKFPIMPKISEISYFCKKKVEMIRKRKRNIGLCSKKSIKVSKRLSSEKNEHTKRAAADTSFEDMVLKPENPANSLKKDLQLEPSVVGAADVSRLEALRGQGKQFENISSFVMGTRMPSRAVDGKSGKRRTSKPKKETSSRTLCSIAKKCIVPSEGIFDCSVQQDILLKKPSSDKDAVLENGIHKIPEDKDGNKKEKSTEHYSEKEGDTNKVTSRENEQYDVPKKIFMDKHAEGNQSNLKSREERIIVLEEKADGCNSVSGQEQDSYMRENQLCRRPNEQDSKSEGKIARNDSSTSLDKHAEGHQSKLKSREERIIALEEKADGCNSVSGQEEDSYMRENQLCRRPNEQDSKSEGKISRNDSSTSVPGNAGVTPDHVDFPPEKQLIVGHVHRATDKIDSQPDYGCDGDGQVLNRGDACQEEPKGSRCNGDSKAVGIDVSGNQSSKIREFKTNVADGNNTELKRNGRCIGDGGGAHHGDSNHQYPSKLKEAPLCVGEKSKRKSGDSSLCCDGENRVAETSECKTRHGTGSSRRELQWQVTFSSNDDDENRVAETSECKTRQGTGSSRRELQWQVTFSSNDTCDSKRWGNMRSAFPPAGSGAGQWHGHFSYPRGPEHGITGWQSPPFHPTSPACFTSGWHSPHFYPRRPARADYTTYQNNLSNVDHGTYRAMGTDPASRYSPGVNYNNGAYQPHMDICEDME